MTNCKKIRILFIKRLPLWRRFCVLGLLFFSVGLTPAAFAQKKNPRVTVQEAAPAAVLVPPAGSVDDPVNDPTSRWFGRSFDKTSAKIMALGFAGSMVMYPTDEATRGAWVNYQQMDKDTAHIGDLLGTGVPGLLIGLTQYKYDHLNGEAHLKSWLAAGVWTYALKIAVGRQRPGGSSSRHSWPSGHTSTAFVTATSLGLAYGWKVGVPATLVASGVGLSRMADDAHWFSDVIMGAAIGVWMGYAYSPVSSKTSQPQTAKTSQILLVPSFGNETLFLTLLSDF